MKLSQSDYVLRKTQFCDNKTFYSYYAQKVRPGKKKWVPYRDANGILMRLNVETGEVIPYLRNIVKESKEASKRRSRILLSKFLEMNDFDFFVTLTFSPWVCDRTSEVQTLELYKKYMDKLSHIEPCIRYIAVPELHKKDHAFHYHLLIGGIHWKKLGLTVSGKVCCHWATRTNGICSVAKFELEKKDHILELTDGMTVYNVSTYAYGFATCTVVRDKERCSTYIKKYIDKAFGTTNKFKKRFYYSRNLKLPEELTELIHFEKNGLKDAYFDNLKDLAMDVDDDFIYAKNINENDEFGVLQYYIPKEIEALRDDGWKI